MNQIQLSNWQIKGLNYYSCLLFLMLTLGPNFLHAQKNLVPNPGFEEIADCDFDYGEVDKAPPWQIINQPIATPDLFHTCSESPFFVPPTGAIYPKSGDGMIGLVNMVNNEIEERVYARLLEDLPLNTDIYVAYAVRPRPKFYGEFEILCYSNTQSLAFSDVRFQEMQIVLDFDTIFSYTEDWTTMETCFRANGTEKFVLLGNFKYDSETLNECTYTDTDFNFAYTYVDDVIVSPFDVVPDTLFICGDEVLDVDATFYEVPIEWSDGWQGAVRTIDQAGEYTVRGDIGACFMTDRLVVIKIPEETEEIPVDLCEGDQLTLESPLPAVWDNGDTSTSFLVNRPGRYRAKLLSTCGERWRAYLVEEVNCRIRHFVPNAFSPNGDGVNDHLEFFFKSDYEFTGELHIFDRWGNRLFEAKNVDALNPVRWNGRYQGVPLERGVYVWVFRYTSSQDGKTHVLSGNATLIR
jgi:gliding motility-associated-like protein